VLGVETGAIAVSALLVEVEEFGHDGENVVLEVQFLSLLLDDDGDDFLELLLGHLRSGVSGEGIQFIEDGDEEVMLGMTMHKSKGLEADYVLILGMFSREHGSFCFPSERDEDPLMHLVLSPREALPDAEERRLFYVALTRAKHQVVLLTHAEHPSKYVTELLRDHHCGGAVVSRDPISSGLPDINDLWNVLYGGSSKPGRFKRRRHR
jgi:superfamily I DNA/RNA helicase